MDEELRSAGHRLEERLRTARERGFVGRLAERTAFRSALDGKAGAFSVLYVHGPGGIGKSALLQRFADDSRAAGRPVCRIDGRAVDPTPKAFAEQAGEGVRAPGAVLLVDTFERCEDIGPWLRRDFVPGLADDALVIVASRRPPGPEWRADLGWSEALQVVALRNLAPDEATALLEVRGVPEQLRRSVLEFASGHPLALSLAAEVAASGTAATRTWTPTQDVIETLLSELVGSVPSPAHQHALEVCAHAHSTTEELLRAVLPRSADADALFGWLRGLPFIESGPGGLFPHDVVRDALDADLRWRDPQGYEQMHLGIRDHLLERARTAQGPLALQTLRALSFLHRHGGVMPDFITWRGEGEVQEDVLRASDAPAVVALARTAEGEQSARIAEFWLGRQPDAFRVYRSTGTGQPVGFMAWLRLDALSARETQADPVVAAAWEHSRTAGPVRSGEHLALARFMVYPAAYQRPSPVSDLIGMRVLSEWLRSERLAWSYMVIADPDFWRPQMDYLDLQAIPETPSVGGRDYTLFAHDWRAVPVERWLDRRVAQELFGTQAQPVGAAPELAVLSREEFDTAVRGALGAYGRTDLIGTNPLARSRLVADQGDAPAADALRAVLVEAVDTLAQDARSARLHRVLATTFFHGVPTREAAAERLSLPLSTYRRHLARGIEQVCDQLWEQELYGATAE